MRYQLSDHLTQDARSIRNRVFVEEQGFHDEFDRTDDHSLHLVAYDGRTPVCGCRIFQDDLGEWTIGRVAVVKEWRGRHLGAGLLAQAELVARQRGADRIKLHAREAVEDFYQKQGYASTGVHDEDERCPHVWMDKVLPPLPRPAQTPASAGTPAGEAAAKPAAGVKI